MTEDTLLPEKAQPLGLSDAEAPVEAGSSIRRVSKDDLLALPAGELKSDILLPSLAALPEVETLHTAAELLWTSKLEDVDLAKAAVELAAERGGSVWKGVEAQLCDRLGGEDSTSLPPTITSELVKDLLLDLTEHERVVAHSWASVQTARIRLGTWEAIWPSVPSRPFINNTDVTETATGKEVEGEGIELDDPWEEEDVPQLDDPWESGSSKSNESVPPAKSIDDTQPRQDPIGAFVTEIPPFPLSRFLSEPLPLLAIDLASSAALHALKTLLKRHPSELFLYRFAVLETIPPWVPPVDLDSEGLLPAVGEDGMERIWLGSDRPFTLSEHIQATSTLPITPRQRSTAEDLSEWYASRVSVLDALGLLDLQLGWVQHAASLSVPSLDSMGEDISLLSRLVYDSSLTPAQQSQWSLSTWHSASQSDIVTAYLSNSNGDSIVADIRRLVMPYLYVLESRAERSGQPDPGLVDKLLYEAILSLPLHIALPVFEASKATLPRGERIVRDDMAVARLALACLYGSDQRDVWATMSAIFECLPVWELSGTNPEDDAELTSTTLDSIAAFVRPSVTSPKPPKAKDLFIFFQPLPFASLSRALDILDVHLESGEALARWGVPVQLRFLLQSARDAREQAELAEKMVRRASAGSSGGVQVGVAGGRGARGGAGEEEARWSKLWEDMLKLNGGGDALLRGAFGMISGDEMMRIYLGGLLRSGKFEVAGRMISRMEEGHGLTQELVEDIALTASRELYENAENGNIHSGEMKLAYDCLSIVPSTPAVQEERDFIEATSRLTSFSLLSPLGGGGTMSPVEIRHTKNKLDLIRLVLDSSKEAYKHDELILDLADKLGYRGDVRAKGEVWGMLARSAEKGGEWMVASGYVGKVVTVVRDSQGKSGRGRRNIDEGRENGSSSAEGSIVTGSAILDASASAFPSAAKGVEEDRLREVAWRTSLSLGTQSDFSDIPQRQTLLGWAVELAPAKDLPEVLEAWRGLEEGVHRLVAARKRRRLRGDAVGHHRWRSGGSAGSVGPRLAGSTPVSPSLGVEERVLGSRTAARAARLAKDLGGKWGLNVQGLQGLQGLQSPILASPRLGALGMALAGSASRDGGATGGTGAGGIGAGNGGGGSLPGRASGWDETSEGRRSAEGERPLAAALGVGMDDAERVRRGARRALVKGVGWLLGAEGEMT